MVVFNTPEQAYLQAVKQALADVQRYHGQAQGMCGGMNRCGSSPTRESTVLGCGDVLPGDHLPITGDLTWADHLEKIAFNAAAPADDPYNSRQYFQCANQVLVTARRNFQTENHSRTDLCYGCSPVIPAAPATCIRAGQIRAKPLLRHRIAAPLPCSMRRLSLHDRRTTGDHH